MANYTDCKNKEWTIPPLTIGIVKKVKEKTGVDVAKLVDQKGIDATALTQDSDKFVSVISALTGGSVEEIEDGLDGETVEKATYAIIEVIIDFFPNRSLSRTMKERLPQIRTKIDNQIVKEVDKAIGKFLLTDSPASSEPTQNPTPSES
jgi:hypothetical protein